MALFEFFSTSAPARIVSAYLSVNSYRHRLGVCAGSGCRRPSGSCRRRLRRRRFFFPARRKNVEFAVYGGRTFKAHAVFLAYGFNTIYK
jgi:hypothetical protein